MDMQVFNSPEGQDIRVIDRDGDPWFVAADVCRALDIANPSDTLGRLDSDEHTPVSTEGIPGQKIHRFASSPSLVSTRWFWEVASRKLKSSSAG